MIKIMLISSLVGCVIGCLAPYNGSRFFGALRGIGFGLFLGMVASFILYILEFLERSYF